MATGCGRDARLMISFPDGAGVVKTHRLTYGRASAMYAKANRASCLSHWTVSGRTLRELTDHFHLRTSGQSGGTDELSFYHHEGYCILKSFGGEGAAGKPSPSYPSRRACH